MRNCQLNFFASFIAPLAVRVSVKLYTDGLRVQSEVASHFTDKFTQNILSVFVQLCTCKSGSLCPLLGRQMIAFLVRPFPEYEISSFNADGVTFDVTLMTGFGSAPRPNFHLPTTTGDMVQKLPSAAVLTLVCCKHWELF